MNTSKIVATALLLVFGSACAEMNDPVDTPDGEGPASEPLDPDAEELQATLDAYVDSLIDRDVSVLREIVSSEIVARGAERGISFGAFLERQRASMFRTFDLAEGDEPRFEIDEVHLVGNLVVRVALRFRGEPLKKDFYFVREGREFKLNIMRPGFSRQLRGSSTYHVRNVNGGGDGVTMMCNPNNVTVWPGEMAKVSCRDSCGWWSGTLFQRQGGEIQRRCDWNTWGDDVYINSFSPDGWDCNDYC